VKAQNYRHRQTAIILRFPIGYALAGLDGVVDEAGGALPVFLLPAQALALRFVPVLTIRVALLALVTPALAEMLIVRLKNNVCRSSVQNNFKYSV
jgi:hypothetical protein